MNRLPSASDRSTREASARSEQAGYVRWAVTAALALLLSGCNLPGAAAPTAIPSPVPPTSAPASPPAHETPRPSNTVQPTATLTEPAHGVPSPTPGATQSSSPLRIRFGTGESSTSVTGTLHQGETLHYVLSAFAGQIMRVYVEPRGAELSIHGADGTVLFPADDQVQFWRGELPSTQDYLIDVAHSATAIGPTDKPLLLSIAIVPQGKSSQQFNYADPVSGFELSYSEYFAVGQPPPVFETLGETAVLGLQFTGTTYFDHTNLNEAAIAITTRSAGPAETGCGLPFPPGGVVSSDQITNAKGIDFDRIEYADAGAGNRYTVIAHNVKHGSSCYTISFYLHSGAIGNYPPGISEFDRAGVLNHMQDVLDSFRFLN